MIGSCFEGIRVAGMATAVPKNRETIAEKYDALFGSESVAKFSKTTGVVERRVALEEQTSSDLAFVAASHLLDSKDVDRGSIGVCVYVTQTPDYRFPATACVLHKRLGLSKDCIAFDINLGCSGYVYGMQVVCSLLQSTSCDCALLLVGDTSNKTIAPQDSSAAMLFGDSGSATLLEKTGEGDASPIMTTYRTDGEGFKAIIIPAGAYRNRGASNERVKWGDGNLRSDYDLYMNGIDVFNFTISEVPDMINQFMEENELERDQFDCYAFHQANRFILRQLTRLCKIPRGRLHISMDRYGNTSVTSIPLTLCDRYGGSDDNDVKEVFSCGFGIGLSWGIATFEIRPTDMLPIIETDEHYDEGEVSHD